MISIAALMCHAPIVIPEIAGSRAPLCQRTTRGMRRAASRLVQAVPDVLVVVTPHAPRSPSSWGISDGAGLSGTFERFGFPDIGVQLPGSAAASMALREAAMGMGLTVHSLHNAPLDHGALVPLCFVFEAGWRGPTLIISLPHPGTNTEERFGQALAVAAAARDEQWAILASGDMSHRLTPGAPAGFHPEAAQFDQAFVEAVSALDYARACRPDPTLRELAAEDVVDSTRVACAATAYATRGAEFIDYEGPFGVGYAEAVLCDDSAPPHQLVDIARAAIEREVNDLSDGATELPRSWHKPRAVFVTLRDAEGQLRGCIGQLQPKQRNLTLEVQHCAVAAASADPRFPPVTADELPGLAVEVSVLEPPVPIQSTAALDPKRYGVVVRKGDRRGVLLPNVDGVDTSEQQMRIACQKAGIDPAEQPELERFLVRKAG